MVDFGDMDLTQVSELKPVPDGIYKLRAVSHETRTSQAGNHILAYKFQIEAPKEQATEVKEVSIDFMMTDADWAKRRLLGFLKAAGVTIERKFKPDAVIGKRVGAVCSIEDTLEWGVRNRWSVFLPVKSITARANMSQGDVDQLIVENAMKSGSSPAGGAAGDAGGASAAAASGTGLAGAQAQGQLDM